MNSSFGNFLQSDPDGEAQAAATLLQWTVKLQAMSDLLEFQMSPRDITKRNLITLDNDIREILRELVNSADIQSLLVSTDAVRAPLREAIKKLSLAIEICEMSKTPRRLEQRFDCYSDIHKYISQAIKEMQKRVKRI